MATYTGVADANGDFTVPFPSDYTGGEKITVSAEKDGAIKSIELYAPSNAYGRDVLFSLTNFPNGIGAVTLSQEISGILSNTRFDGNNVGSIWRNATSLKIQGNITQIPANAMRSWVAATSLDLPATLTLISSSAIIGWLACLELICRAINPPTLQTNGLANLNASCIIKVPAASVSAYQAATNWSTFAARIQAI